MLLRLGPPKLYGGTPMIVPEGVFVALIWGAIALTIGGTLTLLILLVRDWKRGNLW